MNENNETAAYQLMDEYKKTFKEMNVESNSKEKETMEYLQKVMEVRLVALKVERKYIEGAMAKGEMDEELYEFFVKALELREEAYSKNVRSRFAFLIGNVFRVLKHSNGKNRPSRSKDRTTQRREGKEIQLRASQAALEHLEAIAKEPEEAGIIYTVVFEYKQMIDRLKGPAQFNEAFEVQKEELRIGVIDVVRSEIRHMYESGIISKDQAKDLRRIINFMESATLYEHTE